MRKIVGFVAWVFVPAAIVVTAWGYAMEWVDRMIRLEDL